MKNDLEKSQKIFNGFIKKEAFFLSVIILCLFVFSIVVNLEFNIKVNVFVALLLLLAAIIWLRVFLFIKYNNQFSATKGEAKRFLKYKLANQKYFFPSKRYGFKITGIGMCIILYGFMLGTSNYTIDAGIFISFIGISVFAQTKIKEMFTPNT